MIPLGESGDYHLQPGSPCIDAGSDVDVADGSADIDCQARIFGSYVDVECDEFTTAVPLAVSNVELIPVNDRLEVNTDLSLSSIYACSRGADKIDYCWLLLNNRLDGKYGSLVMYNAGQNRLYLRNDLNTGWIGGYAPGTDAVIQNSFCKLYCKATQVVRSVDNLTVRWRLELKRPMAGRSCLAWMKVQDETWFLDDWEQKGELYRKVKT